MIFLFKMVEVLKAEIIKGLTEMKTMHQKHILANEAV